MTATISKIVSGGQTGVDRAALEAAIKRGIDYGGWCPKGGCAEDHPTPPGLLTKYPKMSDTPSTEPEQRTEWNVRDSSATLILVRDADLKLLMGTKLTHDVATQIGKPVLIVNIYKDGSLSSIQEWIAGLDQNITLNVAGPRESECPGIYSAVKEILASVLLMFG